MKRKYAALVECTGVLSHTKGVSRKKECVRLGRRLLPFQIPRGAFALGYLDALRPLRVARVELVLSGRHAVKGIAPIGGRFGGARNDGFRRIRR
jgi:hypothetical protein